MHAAAARHRDELGGKADALSALWRQKQLEYTWLRSLMGCHADFWQVTSDALDYALAQTGLADPAIPAAAGGLRERLLGVYRALDGYPDAASALADLRGRGLRTAILSNGSPAMLAAAVDSAGLRPHLDDVISVEQVRIYKPHPSVYRLAADRLTVPPDRICFVSANGWDAVGAAYFGFHAVWINRLGLQRERLPGEPKVEIRSLSELSALLR